MVNSIGDQSAVAKMIINKLVCESVLNVKFGHTIFYMVSIWTPINNVSWNGYFSIAELLVRYTYVETIG